MHREVYTSQLLTVVEQQTPDLAQFQVGDTSLWGLFRVLMYFPLREALERDRVSPALAQRLREAFDALPVVARVAREGMHAAPIVVDAAPRQAGASSGPVLVLASGPSHSLTVDGAHISPIADPWIALMEHAGVPWRKVDVEAHWATGQQPRRWPSEVAPPVSVADIHAAADALSAQWLAPLQALGVAIEQTLSRVLGISLAAMYQTFIERVLLFVAAREAAARWLEATRPRAILLLCYYETCYLPIISAARALGIPTADLQHGMNGSVHAAYTHFTIVPDRGYDVLPDWFVTWGPLSSANVTRWWPAPTRHQVVVGGRWDRVHPDATPVVRSAPPPSASRRLVVTMQDEPFEADVLAAIAAAPAEWQWLVRPHPASARYAGADAASLAAQLAGAGISNAVVVPADAASLPELLTGAQGHVTWASSSWMDAAMHGVPTVFVHPGAGEQFGAEIASGLARHAPLGRDLATIVQQLDTIDRRALQAVVTGDERQARDALWAIIGA